jgi:hypothetical protein
MAMMMQQRWKRQHTKQSMEDEEDDGFQFCDSLLQKADEFPIESATD